jgi:hypothetical protein
MALFELMLQLIVGFNNAMMWRPKLCSHPGQLWQVMLQLGQCYQKPRREQVWVLLHLGKQSGQRFKAVVVHLGWVRHNWPLVLATKYVIELALYQPVAKTGGVGKVKGLFERNGGYAHFLGQTPVGGLGGVFAGAGMAAAGVGPQTTAMVFADGALLQQHLPLCIKQKHAESAVQNGRLVCSHFFHSANGLIVFVYQYYKVFIHI